MVKRGIEWSIEARRDLIHILNYYNKRNGSNRYSIKLNQKIFSTLQTIASNPGIGLKSNFDSVRMFSFEKYQIIYETFDDVILVIMLWDCRQNPDNKTIGRRISRR